MSSPKQRGFSLIELMIVVAIVGIIAAFAYPSYQENIKKSQRTDAQSTLMQIMQSQERFFTENLTYTADLTDLGYATTNNVESDEGFYQVTAAACPDKVIGACVLLTAAPVATGPLKGDGNQTFDSLGNKSW